MGVGIVPAAAGYIVPSNQFIIYDDRLVHVESISAGLTVNQPREIALYVRAFDELARQAASGPDAAQLISATLRRLQSELPEKRRSEPALGHREGP